MSATTTVPELSYRELILAGIALRAHARSLIDALENPRANIAACTARAAEYEDLALRIDALAVAQLTEDMPAARATLYADWATSELAEVATR